MEDIQPRPVTPVQFLEIAVGIAALAGALSYAVTAVILFFAR